MPAPPLCPQAQAARAAAVAEVQRLLATADDLKRLGALREDVAAKQQVRLAGHPVPLLVWHRYRKQLARLLPTAHSLPPLLSLTRPGQ